MFSPSHERERLKCLQILELQGHPSEDEIKSAYRKQALKYHPDKNKSADATDKFQQISAAYKFLTEGDKFLEHLDEEDSILVHIFKSMFPWMFGGSDSWPQSPRDPFSGFRPFFDPDQYEDSDSEPAYDTRPNGSFRPPPRNSGTFRPSYNDFYGEHEHVPPQNQSNRYASANRDGSNNFRSRTFHTSNSSRPSESGFSQHHRQQTDFSETNREHGQYFRENTKSAKKRRKNRKRANYEEADELRQANGHSQSQQQQARAKSPSPEPTARPREQSTQKETANKDEAKANSTSQIKVEKGSAGPDTNQPRKPNKKERKQEERRRERELQEIREQIEQREREAKEKIERKKKAQEEKERLEREKQEEEERKERERREEEEKRRQEERRLQREKEEKERQERLRLKREQEEKERQRREEELRIQALMDEFDSQVLLDENGEFKTTDPDVINIIRRDDLNAMGNAHNRNTSELAEQINGFKTKDLIELQKAADRSRVANHGIGKLINIEAKDAQTQSSRSQPQFQPSQQEQSQAHGGARPKTSSRGSSNQPRSQNVQPQQYFNSGYHGNNHSSQFRHSRTPDLPTLNRSGPGYPSRNSSQSQNSPFYPSAMYEMPPMHQQTYAPAPTPIQPLFQGAFPRRGRRQFEASQQSYSNGRAY